MRSRESRISPPNQAVLLYGSGSRQNLLIRLCAVRFSQLFALHFQEVKEVHGPKNFPYLNLVESAGRNSKGCIIRLFIGVKNITSGRKSHLQIMSVKPVQEKEYERRENKHNRTDMESQSVSCRI